MFRCFVSSASSISLLRIFGGNHRRFINVDLELTDVYLFMCDFENERPSLLCESFTSDLLVYHIGKVIQIEKPHYSILPSDCDTSV